MKHAFLFFHLNLAFSSIPEDARSRVIQQCYWPLLKLIKQSNVPIGIELTGWTLEQISLLDPSWVDEFRVLLQSNQCELIGSGWSQLIGPLVPFEVNVWNQKLALTAYQKYLQSTPSLVLVNEMAYSSSLVDLYAQFDYTGMIMDRDNIKQSLNLSGSELPAYALGTHQQQLAVLWSDSVLFQRLQRAVHGDIPLTQYYAYVEQRMQQDTLPLAIYANDAEIFDYRPGRFNTEAKMHIEGEWNRLARIVSHLQQSGIVFVSPTEALNLTTTLSKRAAALTNIQHPAPVKKQAKYNINRWAAAGRNNVWINTLCHKRFQQIRHGSTPSAWQELCELWASDLRTHTTQPRWHNAVNKLTALVKAEERLKASGLQQHAQPPEGLSIIPDAEHIYWQIKTPKIHITVNLRRGLAIDSLAFQSWQYAPLVITHHQGDFDTIELAADYYSGGVIIELPTIRKRLTDLEWVKPEIFEDDENFIITADIHLGDIVLRKSLYLSKNSEKVRISYQFSKITRLEATIRVGIMTFNMKLFQQPALVSVWQGGPHEEVFKLDQECDHTQSVSTLVSSNSSLGSVGDTVVIGDNNHAVKCSWQPSECAAVPMLINKIHAKQQFTRLLFSLCELDDTFKLGGHLPDFELTLTPTKLSKQQCKAVISDNSVTTKS